MPLTNPPPDAIAGMSLSEIAQLAADGRLPPVEKWNPDHCGDSGMRIAADGQWWHEGSPIGRAALVRLFSTVLRREPVGGHVLVTPVEKLSIEVEDAPFIAIEMESEGEGRDRRMAFRLNTDEIVLADAAHPLLLAASDEMARPALLVRDRLEARIARPVFYELVELALAEGAEPLGLWSDGAFLALEPA